MKRLIIAHTLALVLVLGGAALAAPPVAASISIGVTPSLVELAATPGGEGTHELTVSNEGDEAFEATTGIVPLAGAGEAGSAVPWLSVEPATFRLEPEATETLTVAIDVPSSIDSGGRYALVTITTGAQEAEGNGARIAGQLGVPFLITVDGDGDVSQEATVERFAPVVEADGRVGFRALVRSTGNVHVVAEGTVAIDQDDGTTLGSLDFPRSTPILPDTGRLLTTQGSLPLPDGSAYEAAATIAYGEEETLSAEASFTVQPPALAVTDLGVCENLDRGPTLLGTLRNDGELGVLPAVQFEVRDADGGGLGAASLPEPPLVWPEDDERLAVDFPQRLVSGPYVFVLTVQFGDAPPETHEAVFSIGGTSPDVAPLCEAIPGADATPVS